MTTASFRRPLLVMHEPLDAVVGIEVHRGYSWPLSVVS